LIVAVLLFAEDVSEEKT